MSNYFFQVYLTAQIVAVRFALDEINFVNLFNYGHISKQFHYLVNPYFQLNLVPTGWICSYTQSDIHFHFIFFLFFRKSTKVANGILRNKKIRPVFHVPWNTKTASGFYIGSTRSSSWSLSYLMGKLLLHRRTLEGQVICFRGLFMRLPNNTRNVAMKRLGIKSKLNYFRDKSYVQRQWT